MKAKRATLALFVGASLCACATSSAGDMADRAKESITRDSAYEMVSVKEFWSKAAFLMNCIPRDSPAPEPFVIYFEVLPSGKLGAMTAEPNTPVSACIRQHVIGRVFTKPPDGLPYVTKIDMQFEKKPLTGQ